MQCILESPYSKHNYVCSMFPSFFAVDLVHVITMQCSKTCIHIRTYMRSCMYLNLIGCGVKNRKFMNDLLVHVCTIGYTVRE